MNSKKCARCDETVYTIEELKCLDKIWHKTCFKCYECGMILNMKTYKGFNKMPYCNAHCPQARATTVVDTPETRRLAENTKIQSQVKYHEQFEKQKGKLTQVADDPETLRIRSTSKIISNVAYHGDYEKKKQMEERRTLLNTDNVVNNNIQQQQLIANQLPKDTKITNHAANSYDYSANNNTLHHTTPNTNPIENYGQRSQYAYNNNNNGNKMDSRKDIYRMTSNPKGPSGYMPNHNMNYNNDPRYSYPQPFHQMSSQNYHQVKQQQVPQQQRGNNDNQYFAVQNPNQLYGGSNSQNMGRCFRAIYDYSAQDHDEVSFLDGDLIINCQPIDDGWMTGTVQRTGQTGMLPSNYVESA